MVARATQLGAAGRGFGESVVATIAAPAIEREDGAVVNMGG